MTINSMIKKDYINDEIFAFIYTVAMRDAVIQLAYKGEKKPLMKSEILNLLKGEMECLIDKVLNDKYTSQNTYDEDFLRATISISKHINNKMRNEEFTFGNAQKFLNIFLKYLHIISYKNSELKKNFRFCHCPMDQQLLKSIWDSRADIDGDIKLKKRDYFLKSWGNENFEIDENGSKMFPKRYILFQQAVRCLASKDGITPLEYDYRIWNSSIQ